MIASATENTSQHYVNIPLDIFKQVQNPIDAIVFGYIQGWENSTRKSKVYLDKGRERMATDLNVSLDTITRSCNRLVELNLLYTKRAPRGLWYSTRTDVICDNAKCGITTEVITQNAASICKPQNAASNINIPLQYTSSSSSCLLEETSNNQSSSSPRVFTRDDDGLFDGIGTRLTNPNLYKPKNPSRIAYRAILTTDQVNLASQYLGASGEDNKAPHLFSQDQADRKGFIEDVIKRCLDTARKKSVTNRVGLLCAIRDEAWNDGRYVDQETAKETARRERQLERERAFAALKW